MTRAHDANTADMPELFSCAVILSGAKNLARIQARSFDKLRMTDRGENAWVDLMNFFLYKCGWGIWGTCP
jgi:hypothetical protein